ncbi:MAG: hypothetical protein JWP95_905 [Actinotalea sp.]|jgi:hypothetical protein|nr:hypothetical protein [Actinotalea sp.]
MMNSRHRKAASVALVAVALVGVRTASAAGADLGGQQILVGDQGSQACGGSAVRVDYDVAYVAELGGYGIGAADVSGLDARCVGYDVVVTLSGPGGVALAEVTAVVDAGQMSVVLPVPVAAQELTGVSVVLREAQA